jgi:kinetochore protein Nuf2
MPPSSTQYSFPILKVEDICTCLAELGIHTRPEELQHPEKNVERIRGILESLAETTTGVKRDELYQPKLAGLKAVNYPQLHEESIPNLNLFRAVCDSMEGCEILDFCIKDVISPSARRLKTQLSGIINFCKFKADREGLLEQLSLRRHQQLNQPCSLA